MEKQQVKTEVSKSKEQIYRGQKLDFLKSLDVRESAKYLPSRSRRTVLRNFDSIEKFLKRCDKTLSEKKRIKTHMRDLVIVPKMVGLTILVYNGKTFNEVILTTDMIGHRLGEFSLTRSRVNHGEAGIGATKSSKAQK